MINRPRRLRANPLIRGMVRETRVSADSLIYPIFFEEGTNIKAEISAMEGQYRYSPDRAKEIIDDCLSHGVNKVLLFGIPREKDEVGSQAYAENGIVQQAIRAIKEEYKDDIYVITDVCMCEYTSHGHCGILCGHDVDNDGTLKYLTAIAVSHAAAGADMVAPSDMMDGRVAAIRALLDENGYINTPIMSYAVKYASNFYGPFREAANSAPQHGDRKAYQMDYHNGREAEMEAALDVAEGADIIMVKPALPYLDVVARLRPQIKRPLAAYCVSGEYAMLQMAVNRGLVQPDIIYESHIAIKRAGADIILTYFAPELAKNL